MLLGGSEYKHHIRRRLLKRFQKRVEGSRGEHVDLIDDKHPVLCVDRWYLHLVDKLADIIDTVVGGGVKLYDVQRVSLVKFKT